MALVNVVARTAEKVQGSEDKFYRTYQMPSCSLYQWGSQRNGRSGGQYKISPHPGDAYDQFMKKVNEGYDPVGSSVTFQVDDAKLKQQIAAGNKALGAFLDSLLAAAPGRADTRTGEPSKPANPAAPQPAPVQAVDRIAQTNQRALAAISLAATDPAKAITEFSLLNDELQELDEALRKVHSYMSTLGILVEEAVS